MEDLIKREDAIKAVEETPFIRRPILPHYLIAKLKRIPSAEPELIINKDYLVTMIQEAVYKRFLGLEDRPSGEWMEDENGLYCSECKERAFREYSEAMNNQSWYEDVPTKFCPNCGVRMKGAE